MAVNLRTLPLGTVVHNRYRVDQVLGEGGFGVTYRVTDFRDNSIAAMKEYMPLDIAYRRMGSPAVLAREGRQSSYDKFLQTFQKEAQTIYQFQNHPNIIDVRHLFLENNTAYYVMEFISGMDLEKYTRQYGGCLRWETMRPIVEQIVRALSAVHSRGLIHCDISPDNIYLLSNGQVKLLDFGAAKVMLRGEAEASVIMLKKDYAPPEQSKGRNMGPWTDVYSLAVTIYYCMTGRLPPDAQERLAGVRVRWPSQMGTAVPSMQWEYAVQKAMSLNQRDRYQTVEEFWQALNSSTHTPTRSSWEPQPTRNGPVVLECVQGIYAGARLTIRDETLLGVDGNRCHVIFPQGTPGVSRLHLRLWSDQGTLYVMDMGSTYGTFLNYNRLTPGVAYAMSPGVLLQFGDSQVFRIQAESF